MRSWSAPDRVSAGQPDGSRGCGGPGPPGVAVNTALTDKSKDTLDEQIYNYNLIIQVNLTVFT